MPTSLVSCLGQRNEFSEFKSVLNDAQNHVMQPVDVEAMARELVESGGREFVEMVRELTTDLANTKQELEDANRRYERLNAELERRGIRVEAEVVPTVGGSSAAEPGEQRAQESAADAEAEWEEWDRRFQSLLG